MHKYQSLSAWQHAHTLLIFTLRTTDECYHPRARPLFDQIRRAAISVEANIVEGYALSTAPLFRRHLRIALGSAAEAECLLRAALELEYLPEDASKCALQHADLTIRTVYGLLRSPNLTTRR